MVLFARLNGMINKTYVSLCPLCEATTFAR